jgi:hypothetical protein
MKKWSIATLSLALLSVAVLLAPAGASAAGSPYCPSGQTGTPPYCQTPPPPPPKVCATGQVGTYPNCITPAVSVGKARVNAQSAKVAVTVNAPGHVRISGRRIVGAFRVTSGGKVTLPVKLTKAGRRALKLSGRLRIKAKIVYTPDGGAPIAKSVTVVLKAHKKH